MGGRAIRASRTAGGAIISGRQRSAGPLIWSSDYLILATAFSRGHSQHVIIGGAVLRAALIIGPSGQSRLIRMGKTAQLANGTSKGTTQKKIHIADGTMAIRLRVMTKSGARYYLFFCTTFLRHYEYGLGQRLGRDLPNAELDA